MFCPNCGKDSLQDNSLKDKCYCINCSKYFELTEVNAWYKGTCLEGENVEFQGV